MTTATYTLHVDWNNNGSFADSGENITDDLISATIDRGFSSPLARVASTGRASFLLRNLNKQYSPALEANVLPRRPVRFRMTYSGTTVTLFRGFIEEMKPAAGIRGERKALMECVDAMALLDIHEGETAILENAYADDIVSDIVSAVYTPPATNYQAGINLFPLSAERWSDAAGISVGNEMVTASNKISDAVASDWGLFFVSKAGAPTFFNRHKAALDTDTKLTLADTMTNLDYTKRAGEVFNQVEVTCNPRAVSKTREVLGRIAQGNAPRLETGSSQKFIIAYRDPHNPALAIGGKDALAPVAGLDLVVTSDEAGAGTVVTGSISISTTFYADKTEITLTNNSGAPAFVQQLQVRGFAVRVREPVTVAASDNTSITAYQRRKLAVGAPLMNNESEAQRLAEHLLASWKTPLNIVTGIEIVGNSSATLMAAVRDLELYDRVVVSETQTGLSNFAGFIYRMTHVFRSKHDHRLRFDLATAFDVGGAPFRIGISALNSGHILIY